MKKLFTLCFLFVSFYVSAQPSLLSSEMATPGMVFTYKHVAAFNMIDTTIQGPNMTWDFSAATATADPDYLNTIIDPANINEADSFPGANWGLMEGPGEYYFFQKSSTQMERLGSYDPVDGYTYYSNTQIEYMFPMVIGQSFTDVSVSTNNGSTTQGNYSFDCMGYGTLIAPGHTYPDVLMTRVTLDIGFISITSYIWYDSNNGMPVFDYVPGDGGFIPEAAIWLNSVTSGIEDAHTFVNVLYSNPVNDLISVRIPDAGFPVNYELTDIQGRKIAEGKFTGELNLNVQNEVSGTFFMRLADLNDATKQRTIRIVKQNN